MTPARGRRQTARLAGALYAAMGVFSALSLTYFPAQFVVPGDAAATGAFGCCPLGCSPIDPVSFPDCLASS